MGHIRARKDVCAGFSEKRLHLEDLGIDGNVILKYLKGLCWGRRGWTGLVWLRIGTSGGCYVCRNKL
jgi:hypothetical protein